MAGVPAGSAGPSGALTSVPARQRSRVRLAALGAGSALVLLAAAGCQSASPDPAARAAATGPLAADVPAATITFAPLTRATGVRPDVPVSVTAHHGRLTSVTVVDGKGRRLPGRLGAGDRTWTTTSPLRLRQHYRVSAVAVDGDGATLERSAAFSTVRPKALLKTSISPLSGSTVGVGMPIVVRFNKDVGDRAAVERGLTVTSRRPLEGSWSWISDAEVHYRPRSYWPAYDTIRLAVRLRGVDAGRRIWSRENRNVTFRTAAAMVSTVDVRRYTLTVRRDGAVARTIPVSTGKAGFLTRNGTKVVLEKHTLKIMDASTIGIGKSDPEYYRLEVPYALRITWSGEFVHAAPWSVGSQGRDNVSHGCVGMSMSNAIWLFNRTYVGDVVRVVGSPRTLEPGNGYTDWNVSWRTWLNGSALRS